MSPYTFQINLYDLLLLAELFSGLTLALLLLTGKTANRKANTWLGLSLLVGAIWITRILAVIILASHLPINFSLAFGPLLYLYVRQLFLPQRRFSQKELLNFLPLLPELVIGLFFPGGYFIISGLAWVSVAVYLCLSHRDIIRFYQSQRFNEAGDRYRVQLRWVHRWLFLFGALWLLWIPIVTLHLLSVALLDGLLMSSLIGLAAMAHLRTETVLATANPVARTLLPAELKQKGSWLKKELKTKAYYLDPELTLVSLAEKLGLTTHELSRIINAALKKNFNDFINDYRIAEVIRKMKDPSYSRLTLLGIAYDSGFNAKTTFSRAFRQVTGKTPGEYSDQLKKEGPIYKSELPLTGSTLSLRHQFNRKFMIKSYFKVAWRSLLRNKAHTLINITGLTAGMAVAMLIGLWVWDELSYDHYFKNHDRIVQVMQHQTFNGDIGTQPTIPLPLGATLRQNFKGDFDAVVLSTGSRKHSIAVKEKLLNTTGSYMQAEAPDLLSLRMLKGSGSALQEPSAILLSESLAKSLFGDAEALNQLVTLDNKYAFKVGGVYADLPQNTTFNDLAFIAPWDRYLTTDPGLKDAANKWTNNAWELYALLKPSASIDAVSAQIKDLKMEAIARDGEKNGPATLFLQPMNKWHLYGEFKSGVNTGGKIEFVWMFGIIGVFVLLLACINFMNLSTARSEKRAKEVGIRKTLGSLRSQLISQFFSESLLVAGFSFVLSILVVWVLLPWFNELSAKDMHILWTSPVFWAAGLAFTLLTGMIAGSYPAFYLSAFQPVKVLKGTFRIGTAAALPRKILVVLQFAVSAILIIGTIVVFRQVQYTKNRPVGYQREGLLTAYLQTPAIHNHFAAVRQDLLASGAIAEMAESGSPLTAVWESNGGFSWPGKDPSIQGGFNTIEVSPEYGKTVGWQIIDGRDFSKDFRTDSAAFVVNEAAVKYMNLKNPVGQTIKWFKDFKIIGVVKDMVMQSPYDPVQPTLFNLQVGNVVDIRLNPKMGTAAALDKVAAVFKQYDPGSPFNYQFTDTEYAQKFQDEERTGKLAGVFTVLAILISCLGLSGMASFMAEQRVKEIGVRKVLGASTGNLWGLLSKDFVVLVGISLLIAIPLGYYFMSGWLSKYQYHAELSWWIFALTAIGAMSITLLTVSYRTLRAALANPVRSLRSE